MSLIDAVRDIVDAMNPEQEEELLVWMIERQPQPGAEHLGVNYGSDQMTARGIRNRNPGNLDFNPRAFARDPWIGELGLEDHPHPRFTTFDTAYHGIRALCKVLLTYYRQRLGGDGSVIDTVQEMVDRWAAAKIENDTDAYAEQVRNALDVERGQVIDFEDPEILMKLAAAIIRHENGAQPYGQDTLRVGALMALDWSIMDLMLNPCDLD